MVGFQSAEKGTIRQEKQSTILQRCLEFESVSSRRLIVEARIIVKWSIDLQDRVHSRLPRPSASSGYWRRQGHSLACDDRSVVRRGPASHLVLVERLPWLFIPEDNFPSPCILRSLVLFGKAV